MLSDRSDFVQGYPIADLIHVVCQAAADASVSLSIRLSHRVGEGVPMPANTPQARQSVNRTDYLGSAWAVSFSLPPEFSPLHARPLIHLKTLRHHPWRAFKALTFFTCFIFFFFHFI